MEGPAMTKEDILDGLELKLRIAISDAMKDFVDGCRESDQTETDTGVTIISSLCSLAALILANHAKGVDVERLIQHFREMIHQYREKFQERPHLQ